MDKKYEQKIINAEMPELLAEMAKFQNECTSNGLTTELKSKGSLLFKTLIERAVTKELKKVCRKMYFVCQQKEEV